MSFLTPTPDYIVQPINFIRVFPFTSVSSAGGGSSSGSFVGGSDSSDIPSTSATVFFKEYNNFTLLVTNNYIKIVYINNINKKYIVYTHIMSPVLCTTRVQSGSGCENFI